MTEAAIHPRISQLASEFQKRLIAMDPNVDEAVLMARIVVRKGVPRKVKWTQEKEDCYD